MARHHVQIENLSIRIPRAMAGSARHIAGEVGPAILKTIAEATHGNTGKKRIDEMSPVTIEAIGGGTDIQKRAVEAISTEVKKRLGQGETRG